MKSWYSIKNLAGATAEITIFDEIGVYGVSAPMFLAALNAIPGKDVNIYINSPGGNVIDAIAMMTGMRLSGKNIVMTVMGIAASAASYLLLGANKRVMPENTFQFLHKPANPFGGNADEHRALADDLDKMEETLVATYAKRTGKSPEQIKALLNNKSYLTAAECFALGLCDEVTPAVQITARYDTDRPDIPAHIRTSLQANSKPSANTPIADRINAIVNSMGMTEYATVFALDAKLTTVEAATAAIANAREVRALCAVAKKPELAGGMIESGVTADQARATLRAMLDADVKAATAQKRRETSDVNVLAIYDQMNGVKQR